MNRIEQLEKQVEVLREACEEWRGSAVTSYDAYGAALVAEADRIAAEPVEATDWEVIREWAAAARGRAVALDSGSVRLWDGDGSCVFEGGVPTAAAWVRAQGGGK